MTRTIHIKNKEQLEKINRLACEVPYEVRLCTSTVMLDPRSMLSLFQLIGQQIYVVAKDDVDPKSFSQLVNQMG